MASRGRGHDAAAELGHRLPARNPQAARGAQARREPPGHPPSAPRATTATAPRRHASVTAPTSARAVASRRGAAGDRPGRSPRGRESIGPSGRNEPAEARDPRAPGRKARKEERTEMPAARHERNTADARTRLADASARTKTMRPVSDSSRRSSVRRERRRRPPRTTAAVRRRWRRPTAAPTVRRRRPLAGRSPHDADGDAALPARRPPTGLAQCAAHRAAAPACRARVLGSSRLLGAGPGAIRRTQRRRPDNHKSRSPRPGHVREAMTHGSCGVRPGSAGAWPTSTPPTPSPSAGPRSRSRSRQGARPLCRPGAGAASSNEAGWLAWRAGDAGPPPNRTMIPHVVRVALPAAAFTLVLAAPALVARGQLSAS
jgi:hypothetical protein